MAENEDKPVLKIDFEGFDPVGLKSAAELSKEATKFGLEAAKVFLNATCKPLLEEFGLAMSDKITNWRLSNILKMLEKAKGKLVYDPDVGQLKINPRVAYQIVEHVSTISDDNLQDMWAGLFAASCNSIEDDENIFFTDILNRLTAAQVKLLSYICVHCQKRIEIQRLPESRLDGDVMIPFMQISYQDILREMGTQSRLKADSEFSQLESMGLLNIYILGGSGHLPTIYNIKSKNEVSIRPMTTAIRLFVKCQGSCKSPFEFFLPEMLVYYQQLLNEDIDIKQSDILNFIEQEVMKDEQRQVKITWDADTFDVELEGPQQLSANDLTTLLRPLIIRYRLEDISKEKNITINKKPFGKFNYKNGFTTLFRFD